MRLNPTPEEFLIHQDVSEVLFRQFQFRHLFSTLRVIYDHRRICEICGDVVTFEMFHDRILRTDEIKDFQETLQPHQLATIALSPNDRLASAVANDDDDLTDPGTSRRTGPSTVLDRAVMEHNLLASSKIYSNITFRGLGNLLDLSPSAAETMARRMIEQGRLKGTIDQVDKLVWFETISEDDDAQGKAGGLGDVEQVTEDTGAPFTKRWDMQIRMTEANVSIYLAWDIILC